MQEYAHQIFGVAQPLDVRNLLRGFQREGEAFRRANGYGVAPGFSVLLAPVILALLIACALGVGTLLAALIVAQRDFKYVLNFAVQLWMMGTPCIYLAANQIGELGQWLMPLNPVYGLILNFRQCMLNGPLDWYALGVSGGLSLLLLFGGAAYFRRVEKGFADII